MQTTRASERLVKELTRVRLRKIAQLRTKIRRGHYRVKNEQIAKVLALTM